MKHCKKCELIFDMHEEQCGRCGRKLNIYEPGHEIHHMNVVFEEGASWKAVESMLEEYEAQSHVDYLRSRHIPAIKILNQEGVLSKVYLGKAITGYDVFVPEAQVEAALAMLEEYFNAPFDMPAFDDD